MGREWGKGGNGDIFVYWFFLGGNVWRGVGGARIRVRTQKLKELPHKLNDFPKIKLLPIPAKAGISLWLGQDGQRTACN